MEITVQKKTSSEKVDASGNKEIKGCQVNLSSNELFMHWIQGDAKVSV